MLPGKKYTPDDLLRILACRWWIVVIPLILGSVIAYGVGKRLHNVYRSETLIMLVPQRVPDTYIKSTVAPENVQDRLATLEDQILSRSRLERIIVDLSLYPDLRQTLPMEDVVVRMRSDITVKVEGKESFRLAYISNDAKTAQKTAERLASLFIEESLRDRENVAEDTSQFLNAQLEDAKRRLVEHEKKLEEYRKRYSGELPTQSASNLQVIQNTQMQLQSLTEAADRARERRLLIERQLADAESPDPLLAAVTAPVAPATPGREGDAVETTAQQLETARARLKVLELRAKPDHPDVRALKRMIRELEAKQDAESTAAGAPSSTDTKPANAAEALRQKRIRDLRAQLSDLDRELKEKQQQEQQLHSRIAEYQAKLDALPTRESELVELTRDYTTLQTAYQTLLAKREDSKMAANLERRNIGQQFKVLDPARVPERPFSPNRRLIYAGGAGGGFGLGLLIVAFLEYMDSSLRREDEVLRLIELPVLALIPVMRSPSRGRGPRWRAVAFSLTTVLVLLGSAFAVWWRMRS